MISPDAPVKLYVTATAEARAARRFKELAGQGHATSFEDVLADIRARDARDAGRADAPMRAAEDAVRIDTTELDVAAAIARAVAEVAARPAGGADG